VRAVLQGEGLPVRTLSVVFVGSRFIRSINRRYLGHDWVTDVLAFPLSEGRAIEGEIYVNLDRARMQARQYKVSTADETRRLIVHGVLHLAGYDDGTASTRRRMTARENHYVERLGHH
jgi:probable rRNA maturation factor